MANNTLVLNTADYKPAPFSPLLPWCRHELEKRSEKEIVRILGERKMSPDLEKLFLNYMKKSPCGREEILLPMEEDYERDKLFRLASELFFSLLDDKTETIHIRISGPYSHYGDRFYSYLEDYASRKTSCSLILINTGEIIPWDGISRLSPPQKPDIQIEDRLYRRALEFLMFGDNIRACQYFDLLYSKSRSGNLEMNAEQRASLFHYYGQAAMNLEQDDLALTIFSSLRNLGQALDRILYLSRADLLTGEVYRRQKDRDRANYFYRRALGKSSEDPLLRLKILMALCLNRKGAQSPLSQKEQTELLLLIGKQKKCRALALYYGPNPDFTEALKLLKEEDYPSLTGEACYFRALHDWERRGNPPKIRGYLERALTLSLEGKSDTLEIRVLKALGRLELNVYNLDASYAHYSWAIQLAIREERFTDVALIYIRFGEIALHINDFKQSRSFLRSAQYILNRLPRSESVLKERVNIFLALALYAEGDKAKAEELFHALPPQVSPKNRSSHRVLSCALAESSPEEWETLGNILSGQRGNPALGLYALRQAGKEIPPPCADELHDPLDHNLMDNGLKQFIRFEQLKKGLNEMNLLSDVQALLASSEEKELIILRTMERLLSFSLINGISYYERLGDSYRLAYHSSLKEEEPDRQALENFLNIREKTGENIFTLSKGYLGLSLLKEKILSGVIIIRPESSHMLKEEEDRRFFSILASQFAFALERLAQRELILSKNRQLEEINRELTISNMTDQLTGIGNRAQMNEQLAQFAHQYNGAREKDNFALLFLDLDNFKFYNDTFGHALGDRLLSAFSQLLKQACRESDTIFRYGGDEFVVLLAETDSENSVIIAQRILYDLEDQEGFATMVKEFGQDNTKIKKEKWLACSIGISDYRRAKQDTSTLLKQADGALYEAKEAGKGQWKIFDKDEKDE
ncbi:MAG: GGDEF domain-containing protein [Spirochaetales bacterium]|nr:GGDEF domain-containing protein [Spirochaetales bacterium]